MKKLIETIKGLEQYRDAGWTGINDYYRPFVTDALELLKAQEPKLVACEMKRVSQDDSYDVATYAYEIFYNCPKCGNRLLRYRPAKDIKYCQECGQAVKWE